MPDGVRLEALPRHPSLEIRSLRISRLEVLGGLTAFSGLLISLFGAIFVGLPVITLGVIVLLIDARIKEQKRRGW